MNSETHRPALLDVRHACAIHDATAILRMLTSDLPDPVVGCRADGLAPLIGH